MHDIFNMIDDIQCQSECDFHILLEASIAHNDILGYYTESAIDNVKTFFQKIYNTIKDIITRMKDSIINLFKTDSVKNQIDAVEKDIKENPSYGNAKIQVRDYKKVDELNDAIRFEIVKAGSIDELEAKMAKYRSQRNKIIAGSILTAATVSTVFFLIFKGKDKKIDQLTKQEQIATENLKKYERKCEDLKEKNKELTSDKRDLENQIEKLSADTIAKKTKYYIKRVQQATDDASEVIQLHKAKAQAEVEVCRNAASDIVSSIKEGFTACKESKNGLFKKIKSAEEVKNDVASTISSVKSGEAKKEHISEKIDSITEKISEIDAKVKKAAKLIANKDTNQDKKSQYREYMKKKLKEKHKLEDSLSALKKLNDD